MTILVIGSLNVDYNVNVASLPKRGESVNASDFFVEAGGKGANQAVASARLGSKVAMIGKVGSDSNGDMLIDLLRREGIGVDGISRSSRPTGNAMITVDETGDNTIVVYPGANGDLTALDIDECKHLIAQASLIVMQLEIPIETVEYVADLAKKNGIPVILNPAPARRLSDDILASVSILTPNETELHLITGISDVEEAAKSLIAKGVNEVIVTLGSEGSMYVNRDITIKKSGFSVSAIDTTAAGDSFNAALANQYFEDNTKDELLKFCNKVGALTTTKKGAITSLPLIEDLDTLKD